MLTEAEFERVKAALARIKQESSSIPFCPHSPTEKQAEFLALDSFEALYGGAAGGGKSDALLMAALMYVDRPGYCAILFRRRYTDLSLPGALMDRAADWLMPTAAKWVPQDKRWLFPSGASLSFGYIDSEQDKYRYQSAEFQFVGVDELTQFRQTQYQYLLSRVRRLRDSEVALRSRSATNPGGIGHDWVKARFVDSDIPFVPAKIADNPHLDAEQYRVALAQLDDVTRDQLERGLWVKDTSGRVYSSFGVQALTEQQAYQQWFAQCQQEQSDIITVIGVDLGASQTEPTTAYAVCTFRRDQPGIWVQRSEAHAHGSPSEVAEHIRALSAAYKADHVVVDAGALGAGYLSEFQDRYKLDATAAKKQNKLAYRKLLNGAFRDGKVRLVHSENQALAEELMALGWNSAQTDVQAGSVDHLSDALLYAWRECYDYAPLPKEIPPKPGTQEHDAWLERKMFERDLAAHLRQKKQPWWGMGKSTKSQGWY